MTRFPATRIWVRRIVIDVNRDLTPEQLAILDEALKRLGLAKATKVTLHHHMQHKPQPPRMPPANRDAVPRPEDGRAAGTPSKTPGV